MSEGIRIHGARWTVGAVLILMLSLGPSRLALAQDDEGPMASVKVVVVRDASGKPVKNAQVVLHPVNKKGKATRGELDLKTNEEGRASIDGIPYGSIEVQVLAPGLQTFGQDYEVKQPEIEITVRLKRPGEQYSTYENHDTKQPPEQKPH